MGTRKDSKEEKFSGENKDFFLVSQLVCNCSEMLIVLVYCAEVQGEMCEQVELSPAGSAPHICRTSDGSLLLPRCWMCSSDIYVIDCTAICSTLILPAAAPFMSRWGLLFYCSEYVQTASGFKTASK